MATALSHKDQGLRLLPKAGGTDEGGDESMGLRILLNVTTQQQILVPDDCSLHFHRDGMAYLKAYAPDNPAVKTELLAIMPKMAFKSEDGRIYVAAAGDPPVWLHRGLRKWTDRFPRIFIGTAQGSSAVALSAHVFEQNREGMHVWWNLAVWQAPHSASHNFIWIGDDRILQSFIGFYLDW